MVSIALCINSNAFYQRITLIVLHTHAHTQRVRESAPFGRLPPSQQLAQCGPVLSPSAAAAAASALPCDIGQVEQSYPTAALQPAAQQTVRQSETTRWSRQAQLLPASTAVNCSVAASSRCQGSLAIVCFCSFRVTREKERRAG